MEYARIVHEPQARGGWRAICSMLGLVISQKLISYGILTTFVLYLERVYHFEHDVAFSIIGLWSSLNGVLLFGGAFVSDNYLGRYRTIVFSSSSLMAGTVILTITSKDSYLCSQKYPEAHNQCPVPTNFNLAFVYLAMCLVSAGAGGIVSCSTPFIVDQIDSTTDDGRAIAIFYRWYYFITTAVVLFGVNIVTYLQINGSWTVGFLIYTSCMICSFLLFIIGRKTYVHEKTAERPISFREKMNFIWKIFPLWVTGLCPLTSIVQQITFTFFQAAKMNLHVTADFQMRAAWIFPISMLAVGILLMINDYVVVPLFKKITGYQSERTMLQRIGIGIMCSVAGMVVGGVVEKKRRDFALSHSDAVMSVFYLFPQLFLLGICIAYFVSGQLELFNRECPKHMENTANAFVSSSKEIATYVNNYLSMSLQWITGSPNWLFKDLDQGRLEYYYFYLFGLGLLNFLCYLYYSTRYQYKDSEDGGSEDGGSEDVGSEDGGNAPGDVAMLPIH